jgi:hypothetical protein
MVCLFNLWSATDVKAVLNDLGYKHSQTQYFWKAKKTFKHRQAPYISQVQPGAYFFKDEAMMNGVDLGAATADTNTSLYMEQRRNLHEVETPPAVYDEQGKKMID